MIENEGTLPPLMLGEPLPHLGPTTPNGDTRCIEQYVQTLLNSKRAQCQEDNSQNA